MSIDFKTFCLAPWVHATVHTDATMRPCCMSKLESNTPYHSYITWWNGESMRSLRKDLSNGIKNDTCRGCWSQEILGKESLRHNYNNLFKNYADYNEIKNAEANNYIASDPKTWDLRLGNLCNIKCVMCNSTYSNKIADEVTQKKDLINRLFPNKLSLDTVSQNWTGTDTAKKFLDQIFPDAKWIRLQGGEPLAQKNIRDMLDNFSDATLAITTNGTILDQRVYQALAKLPRVEISISVEAVSEANNIIRYGSDWEEIKNNLLQLVKLPNVDLQIIHVLQLTSVFYLADVLQFCEQNNIHLQIVELHKPEYLSLSACPTEYVEQMIAKIDLLEIQHPKNQYIKKYLSNVLAKTTFDQTLNQEFYRYVELLDQMRSKKFSSVLKFKEQPQ